jgi:hypothetical protein
MSSTTSVELENFYPGIDLSKQTVIIQKIIETKELTKCLKRMLNEIESKPKVSTNKSLTFIQVDPRSSLNKDKERKRFIGGNIHPDWHFNRGEFLVLAKDSQDRFLMILIEELVESNSKSGFRAYWRSGKRDIEKFFGVGHDRLDRIPNSVWKEMCKKDHPNSKSLVHTTSFIHGNKGRKPLLTLNKEFKEC